MWLSFFLISCAQGFTNHSAQRTFYVFESAGRPNRTRYQKFYSREAVNFIQEVPSKVLKDVFFAKLYIVRASLSSQFKKGRFQDDGPMMKHSGIGFQLFDSNRVELGRTAVSFWACEAERADFPFLMNFREIHYFNRALVAISISENDWEGGYWSSASFVADLSAASYHKAWTHIREYAELHPYLTGMEVWRYLGQSSSPQLYTPAVTCNTFVQDMIWKMCKRDVYHERLLPVAYSVYSFDSGGGYNALEGDPMTMTFHCPARWYDEHGVVIAKDDAPELDCEKKQRSYVLRSNMFPDQDLSAWDFQNKIRPALSENVQKMCSSNV